MKAICRGNCAEPERKSVEMWLLRRALQYLSKGTLTSTDRHAAWQALQTAIEEAK